MEEHEVTTFGKVLRQERLRKELNQTQLAELVGTTQQNIGHWEAGRTMPKRESIAKLLDIFGHDSPLSYLPPRGEIKLQAKVIAKASASAELDRSALLVGPLPEARPVSPRDSFSRRQAILEGLKAGLPSHLQHFVGKPLQFKGFKYLADYLSPTLCVKAYTPSDDRNVLIAARLGMQTMLMLRAALNEQDPQGDKDRTYILAIVAAQSFNHWVGGVSRRIDIEAEALGLAPLFVTTLDGIGGVIWRIEQVGFAQFMGEADDPDDGEY